MLVFDKKSFMVNVCSLPGFARACLVFLAFAFLLAEISVALSIDGVNISIHVALSLPLFGLLLSAIAMVSAISSFIRMLVAFSAASLFIIL